MFSCSALWRVVKPSWVLPIRTRCARRITWPCSAWRRADPTKRRRSSAAPWKAWKPSWDCGTSGRWRRCLASPSCWKPRVPCRRLGRFGCACCRMFRGDDSGTNWTGVASATHFFWYIIGDINHPATHSAICQAEGLYLRELRSLEVRSALQRCVNGCIPCYKFKVEGDPDGVWCCYQNVSEPALTSCKLGCAMLRWFVQNTWIARVFARVHSPSHPMKTRESSHSSSQSIVTFQWTGYTFSEIEVSRWEISECCNFWMTSPKVSRRRIIPSHRWSAYRPTWV